MFDRGLSLGGDSTRQMDKRSRDLGAEVTSRGHSVHPLHQ